MTQPPLRDDQDSGTRHVEPAPLSRQPSPVPRAASGQPVPSQPTSKPSQRTGFGAALLASLVWAAVNVVFAVALSGPPPNGRAARVFLGGMLVPIVLAALITWVVARRRPTRWPFWRLVLLALPFFLAIRVVLIAVQAAA